MAEMQMACPSCTRAMAITAELFGQQVYCPYCGQQCQIPGQAQAGPAPIENAVPDFGIQFDRGVARAYDRFRRLQLPNAALVFIGAMACALVLWLAILDVRAAAETNRLLYGKTMSTGDMAFRFAFSIFTWSFALAFFFLPSVVGYLRKHQNAPAILATNVLLGITGIGWIAALIWSFTEVKSREHRHIHYHHGPPN